jgi:hypothetical protein
MGEPTVPKRRRTDPEPTAGSASSGTEPARHSAETLGGGSSHDGATKETEADMRKWGIRMAKDYILVGEIRSACHDQQADPTKTIRKIQDLLERRALSEDEAPAPGPQMVIFPPEEVATCDQQ